jgi:hypothetical protein
MRDRRERGQATVEFALIIPLVLVALMAVLQVGLVAYSHLAVTHVAREAARTLAVDASADIGHLTDERVTVGANELVIEVHFDPGPIEGRNMVSVRVSYETPAMIRFFEPFSEYFAVHHEVRMLTES